MKKIVILSCCLVAAIISQAQTDSLSINADWCLNVRPEMPRFHSCQCEEIENRTKRENCAQDALLKFIYENLDYPEAACKQGITGTVVIRFEVDYEGKLSDFELLRSIGGGCDEEAMRVAQLMPDWIPPKKYWGGEPRVYFNLPIVFR